MKIKVNCTNCGKTFEKYVRKQQNTFCCRKCMFEWKGGKNYIDLYGEDRAIQIRNKLSVLNSGENNGNYKKGNTLLVKCECGNSKDYRATSCSLCSGKSFIKEGFTKDIVTAERLRLVKDNISDSTSFVTLAEKTNLSRTMVTRITKENSFSIDHFRPCAERPLPIDTYFVKGQQYRNGTIKRLLLENNLKQEVCEKCGIGNSWNNTPLTIELHHINGDSFDNTLENLLLLCPNCHSQTDNNKGKKSKGVNKIRSIL
jgi:endogenous inhibitor of DNA gyrase (YacG/DUF329 family)